MLKILFPWISQFLKCFVVTMLVNAYSSYPVSSSISSLTSCFKIPHVSNSPPQLIYYNRTSPTSITLDLTWLNSHFLAFHQCNDSYAWRKVWSNIIYENDLAYASLQHLRKWSNHHHHWLLFHNKLKLWRKRKRAWVISIFNNSYICM